MPLPGTLQHEPFTVYASRALGVPEKRLRGKDLVDGGRLIYLPEGRTLDLRERARVVAEATPGAWVSHQTAAELTMLGLPPWMDCETIHLSKPHGLPRARRAGVTGHRVRVIPGSDQPGQKREAPLGLTASDGSQADAGSLGAPLRPGIGR